MPDTALKIWVGIPPGSRLEVRIASETVQWAGDATVVTSRPDGAQEEAQWVHEELHPGPRVKELEPGCGYTVGARVSFTGSTPADAVIHARVVKSNGAVYGSEYAYAVSGTGPEVARSTIIAVTKRSGGSP